MRFETTVEILLGAFEVKPERKALACCIDCLRSAIGPKSNIRRHRPRKLRSDA
jgi:hypothetical protein